MQALKRGSISRVSPCIFPSCLPPLGSLGYHSQSEVTPTTNVNLPPIIACFMRLYLTRLSYLGLSVLLLSLTPTRGQDISPLTPALQASFGTPGFDFPYSAITLTNGDVLVATSSDGAGGNRQSTAYGAEDFVLVRIRSDLSYVWDRSFGGSAQDRLYDLVQSADGNILLAGRSLSPVSGNKTTPNLGGNDMWTVLVDTNGTKLWERTLGGAADDMAYGAAVLTNGNYLLAGTSSSAGNTVPNGKTTPNYGGQDYFAVVLDKNGTQVWERNFGGGGLDMCRTAVVLTNGTVVCVGSSSSPGSGLGNKTVPLIGDADVWCVCLDANGQQKWQASYGETNQVFEIDTRGAAATPDGGFIVATTRGIPLGDSNDPNTIWQTEGLVLRFDSLGKLVWKRALTNPNAGTNNNNSLNGIYLGRIISLKTGGYAVSGLTDAPAGGPQLTSSAGYYDAVVFVMDEDGNLTGSGVFGGNSNEWNPAMTEMQDRRVLVAVQSYSQISGNKTVGVIGSSDDWFFTLRPTLESDFQFVTNTGSIIIMGYTSTNPVVVIPAKISGLPVRGIWNSAFSGKNLTSVRIPEGVAFIGDSAFLGCSSLTTIVIPNSVAFIGHRAFSGCSSLTSIVIPNSVASIGDYAFEGCSSLTSIVIPNSLTSIGNRVFRGCSSLTSIVIPNNVASIGNGAFLGCSSLTSIVIPNSVASIGDYVFQYCSGLREIVFLGDVPQYVSYWSFYVAGSPQVTVYYLPWKLGWPVFIGGALTAPLSVSPPKIVSGAGGPVLGAGGYRFQAQGPSNLLCVVESSTLSPGQQWVPLSTNRLINGTATFVDPAATNLSRRFYRLRLQ